MFNVVSTMGVVGIHVVIIPWLMALHLEIISSRLLAIVRASIEVSWEAFQFGLLYVFLFSFLLFTLCGNRLV